MSKLLLACDLDNTLLYSYKHKRDGDVCVELLHEKEQGFMTPRTVELLRGLKDLATFVPITTRSVEQYLRIAWPAGCAPEYALAANGAILLKNGTPEDAWRNETEAFIGAYRDDMRALMPEFSDREKYLRCRTVDDAYLFVYCGHGVDPARCVETYRDRTRLCTVCSGRKVYFFPPKVNKGHALRRLKAMLDPSKTLSAGDSAIDVPMLNEADGALVPSGFDAAAVRGPDIYISPKDAVFSEYILEVALATAGKE